MQPFSVFESTLETRFGGILRKGAHTEDGEACLLECAHAAIGDPWSDTPDRWIDLRSIHDAFTNDIDRTRCMVPVMRAYWDWSEWPLDRKAHTMERLAILIVQRIVSAMPQLSLEIAVQCRQASTLVAANYAANAASYASAAARAASYAADGAAVLETACQCFIEAANEGGAA